MNSATRSKLKSLANKIKPTVTLGKDGINDGTVSETQTALFHHELIKVNVLKSCPVQTEQAAEELSQKTYSEIVQTMGNKITLYKLSDKEEIEHIL